MPSTSSATVTHTPLLTRVALLGTLAFIIGCPAGEGVTDPNPTPSLAATVVSGGNQSRTAGDPSDVMTVRITDSEGEPVAGASVAWTTSGGALATGGTSTNAEGLATNTLTSVGNAAGIVTVTAKAGAATATFSITVAAVPPGSMEKVGSDPSNTAAGASDSIKVRVLDASSSPRAGATVTFVVTAGGGSVSPATATTNAEGIAAAKWTRGTAGVNTVTASSGGQTGSPISFSVMAVSYVASIAYGPTVLVLDAEATTTSATAVVKDGAGVAMTGQTITYTSRTPGVATVDASGQLTGLTKGQAIVVASVTSEGTTFTDSLLAVVAVPGGPVMRADIARFDLRMDTTFTVAILADMRTSTDKIGSGKVTVTWDPALLTYQGHAEGGSAVSATVNATNAAAGSLVLAFANATGFAGAVELRTITFTAAATAKTGSLSVVTNEASAAGTHANLLPNIVSVVTPLYTR